MKKTLIDIAEDVIALDDLLDELEGDVSGQDAAVAAFLEENDRALSTKVDGYAGLISELEHRAAVRKAEAKRIADLAKAEENRARYLKQRLLHALDAMGIGRVDTDRYRVSTANNGGKIPVVCEVGVDDLPEQFVRTKIEHKPDLDALREALEQGAEVPGVRLGERGRSLRIK